MQLQEIADATGVPLATLRWYRHRGHGGPRTFLLGRRVVAYEDDVAAWVEAARANDPAGCA
jgi:hypothetical protein